MQRAVKPCAQGYCLTDLVTTSVMLRTLTNTSTSNMTSNASYTWLVFTYPIPELEQHQYSRVHVFRRWELYRPLVELVVLIGFDTESGLPYPYSTYVVPTGTLTLPTGTTVLQY
jgi:hypothetical protein